MKPLQNSKNISDITTKNKIEAYGLPEHGKLAKTYISLTDPKSKINRSDAYTAKGVHIKALPLWRSVFLCAVRIFPNKKTAKHPKGNHAVFPRFAVCDSAKAFTAL